MDMEKHIEEVLQPSDKVIDIELDMPTHEVTGQETTRSSPRHQVFHLMRCSSE